MENQERRVRNAVKFAFQNDNLSKKEIEKIIQEELKNLRRD